MTSTIKPCRTLTSVPAVTVTNTERCCRDWKMSLGQLAVDIYGDARKLKGISHFVEIDVTGLDVIEPRKTHS